MRIHTCCCDGDCAAARRGVCSVMLCRAPGAAEPVVIKSYAKARMGPRHVLNLAREASLVRRLGALG